MVLLGRVDLTRALGALSERERWIVERHYGLDGLPVATQRQLASEAGIAFQLIGTIEQGALRRLAGALRTYEQRRDRLDQAG